MKQIEEMTERKFTDEEVIKALECCVKDDIIDSSNHEICFECPLKYDNDCSCNLRKRILDLINRRDAEIKKVKSCLEFYLDNNEEKGIVFIPKFVVENRIKEMTEGKE